MLLHRWRAASSARVITVVARRGSFGTSQAFLMTLASSRER